MKTTTLLSLLCIVTVFSGCQSTTTVNDGYGIETTNDSSADQAKILK